jgi:hypothetical protein
MGFGNGSYAALLATQWPGFSSGILLTCGRRLGRTKPFPPMLTKWSLLLAVSSACCTSCSSTQREPLQITVTECVDGFPTQEYDLTTQTMRVLNSLKPDTEIRFTLTAAEREAIETAYDELGMERVDKGSVLEKECGQIPMPCRTLRVVRGAHNSSSFGPPAGRTQRTGNERKPSCIPSCALSRKKTKSSAQQAVTRCFSSSSSLLRFGPFGCSLAN